MDIHDEIHYSIQIWAPGRTPELKISKKCFDELKEARKYLSAALSIEEKYELLLANYLDLESELLKISTINMVTSNPGYQEFFDARLTINRRVVNLLTSTTLYIDQIKKDTKAFIPNKEARKAAVNDLFSMEYDSHFEYRFMEALRNYVQHEALAIHTIKLNSSWTSIDKERRLEYKTTVMTHKEQLESSSGFKKSVLKEIESDIDTLSAARSYVGSLSKVHCEIRKLISTKTESSRNKIEKKIKLYQELYKETPIALHATSFKPAKPRSGLIERFPLLLKWDDIRIKLQQKNKALDNLNKRHITSFFNAE